MQKPNQDFKSGNPLVHCSRRLALSISFELVAGPPTSINWSGISPFARIVCRVPGAFPENA